MSKKLQTTIGKKRSSSKSTGDIDRHVLLRDLATKLLLIVRYSDIVTSQGTKIVIGKEVSYVGPDRIRGRGQILTIG